MRDIVKYVGEDLRSQLLIVALTGTSLTIVIAAYKEYVASKEKEATETPIVQPDPAPIVPNKTYLPLFAWLLTGGLSGVIAYSTSDMFKKTTLSGTATNPWTLIDAMQSSAQNVAGLAWAALFASIIVGEGGIGGILDKAGGGGFGAIGSLAGTVP